MNTNKAPDKIYVLPEFASVVKALDEEVEYIRKDDLLEWLQEKLNWYAGTDFANVYQKVIDKLNSL